MSELHPTRKVYILEEAPSHAQGSDPLQSSPLQRKVPEADPRRWGEAAEAPRKVPEAGSRRWGEAAGDQRKVPEADPRHGVKAAEDQQKVPEAGSRRWDEAAEAPRKVPEADPRCWDEAAEAPQKVPEADPRRWDEAVEAPRKVPEAGSRRWDEAMGDQRKVPEADPRRWDEAAEALQKVPEAGSRRWDEAVEAPRKVPEADPRRWGEAVEDQRKVPEADPRRWDEAVEAPRKVPEAGSRRWVEAAEVPRKVPEVGSRRWGEAVEAPRKVPEADPRRWGEDAEDQWKVPEAGSRRWGEAVEDQWKVPEADPRRWARRRWVAALGALLALSCLLWAALHGAAARNQQEMWEKLQQLQENSSETRAHVQQELLQVRQHQMELRRITDLLCETIEDSKKCPAGWEFYENSCYFFSALSRSWDGARDFCAEFGGDLVVVSTEEEQLFLMRNIQENNTYWMGVTDRQHEGQWTWVSGESVSFGFWDVWAEEPDKEHKDCGLLRANGRWSNERCSEPGRWICEKSWDCGFSPLFTGSEEFPADH